MLTIDGHVWEKTPTKDIQLLTIRMVTETGSEFRVIVVGTGSCKGTWRHSRPLGAGGVPTCIPYRTDNFVEGAEEILGVAS
jgi:hypothetical protein